MENFSGTVTDWVIAGFEVANSPKYGIDVRVTDRITVQGNHVHNSALTGIFTAFSNDVLIQGNESDHNGEHGIYQSNSSVYPTIRGNLSHHNASAGIHMNGDISEQPGNGLVQFATVEDNVIWENGDERRFRNQLRRRGRQHLPQQPAVQQSRQRDLAVRDRRRARVQQQQGLQQHNRDGAELAVRHQYSERRRRQGAADRQCYREQHPLHAGFVPWLSLDRQAGSVQAFTAITTSW